MDYNQYIISKQYGKNGDGIKPEFMPDMLFDFQKELIEWALWKGSSALFENCGMGKTFQELVFAENVHRHTNEKVLLITYGAIRFQFEEEAKKIGIEIRRPVDGKPVKGINLINYEQLHKYDPADFVAIVCDESSILKNFDGVYKTQISEFSKRMKYRLMATATPSPNDYIELGTTSEALGNLGFMDMLNRFFTNNMNNSATGRVYGEAIKWRFKGHAEKDFWQWVKTWGKAVRSPSDLGYDDGKFILPKMTENTHVVVSNKKRDGMLFSMPAVGLKEQREERRLSIESRCEKMAELCNNPDPSMAWVNLNDEGDMVQDMIPGSVQVSGSDSDEEKEEKFHAFISGQIAKLISKPKIGAWGLNFQHCPHVAIFPTHSYEQYYQIVRRCWRFGQEQEVVVDRIASEGEVNILNSIKRKASQADNMFKQLVDETMEKGINIKSIEEKMEIPAWI